MIKIYVRDCNGKRDVWEFSSTYDFIEFYYTSSYMCNEDIYEIQMVIYDGYCIYSGLTDEITFEELCGFFA